ncbi:hypothetical protein NIES4073_32570 [Kalymmatonema gypsitolerans NIES-4073]|nr:hypothetical protein NIES4073_32570 [Scytonema sp. NIES-4073]
MWRLAPLAFWAIGFATEANRDWAVFAVRSARSPRAQVRSAIASYRRADAKHESQHAYCNKSIAKHFFLEASGIDRQILEEIVSES